MTASKRIAALIVAVVLPIALILTGCGKRLTEREYYDELYADFKEYAAALEEIDTVQADVASSQEKMLELTKAADICEKAEKALEKFDKINPPDSFAEKHKTLLEAVKHEKEYVRASRKVLAARTPFEYEQYSIEAAMVFANVPEEQQFAPVLSALLSEVKTAAGA